MLPEYDEFLQECKDVVAAYKRRWRRPPAASDLYHNAWRRLSERWSHRDILHDILGEPLEDGGHGGDARPVVPPQPEVPASTGVVRPVGARSVGDDAGPALQLTLTDFSLLRLYRQDRDAVRQRLREHASKGFTAARVLAQVMGGPWNGREIDPAWPDHLSLVADLTRDAAAAGLRLEWTLVGGGGSMGAQVERKAFARAMAQTLSTVPAGVLFVEMVNEPANRPVAVVELMDMVREFESYASHQFLTSPGVVSVDEFRQVAKGDLRVMTQHLDRDTSKSEMQDRPWRQAWEFGLEGLRWCDNEPIGHGSTISGEQRPSVLRSHRLVAFISRAFASCLHCTPAGVWAEVPWMDIPAYHEAGKARRFLPGNLAEGQPHNANGGFPNRPYDIDGAYLRAQTGNARGLVRLYTVETDGVYYTVPFGLVSEVEITARRDLSVRCCSQEAGEVLWERQVGRDEKIRLPQSTDYLLISRTL